MTSNFWNRPVVVIPVHLPTPSPSEVVSLRHCAKVLGCREIVILAPKNLDLGFYRELLPNATDLRVEPYWMASLKAYNQMMISPLVFEALSGFTHMIVHEPDALILSDEIDYWCNQPFDYIGAPWFEGWSSAVKNARVIGVGNFGFSLHRLSTSRRVTSSFQRWYPYSSIKQDLRHGFRGDRERLRQGLSGLGSGGLLRGAHKLYSKHCDMFWSFTVPEVITDYRLATADIAVQFAWEVLPSRCMEMSRGNLPFGIHAWAKYNFAFLMPHLLAAGVDLNGVDRMLLNEG